MIALAGCYFAAGGLIGAWALHLALPSSNSLAAVATFTPTGTASTAALAPTLKENYTGPSFPFHYDPAHAILPDPKLTPGDVFPDATKDDVCTPGWSSDHRHVTESMRDQMYAEYGRTQGPQLLRGRSPNSAGTRRVERHQEPMALARIARQG
jgi:hypothetical protein